MEKKKITKQDIDQAKLRLYMIMLQHIGPSQKIGMGELYEQVFGRPWNNRINDTRQIRMLITQMKKEGQAVMSSSSPINGGYWIAASGSELDAFVKKDKLRALKILSRISNMKKVSLPELMGQMLIEWNDGNET